jgi:hypothetical protein
MFTDANLEKIHKIKKELQDINEILDSKEENFLLFFLGIGLGTVGNLSASILHQTFSELGQPYYGLYSLVVTFLLIGNIYFAWRLISRIKKIKQKNILLLKEIKVLEDEITENTKK